MDTHVEAHRKRSPDVGSILDDSFEIAVLDEAVIEDPNPDFGWELLGDDTFGWSVTTTAARRASAARSPRPAPGSGSR